MLRLPCFTTEAIQRHLTSTATLASHPEVTVTLDRYTWYHKDYAWPLLACVRVSLNGDSTAFRTALLHHTPDSVAARIAMDYADPEEDGGADTDSSASVRVHPNPTRDFLHVRLRSTEAAEATIRIYCADGRLAISGSERLDSGSRTALLDLRQLSAGYYILDVDLPGGGLQTLIIKL